MSPRARQAFLTPLFMGWVLGMSPALAQSPPQAALARAQALLEDARSARGSADPAAGQAAEVARLQDAVQAADAGLAGPPPPSAGEAEPLWRVKLLALRRLHQRSALSDAELRAVCEQAQAVAPPQGQALADFLVAEQELARLERTAPGEPRAVSRVADVAQGHARRHPSSAHGPGLLLRAATLAERAGDVPRAIQLLELLSASPIPPEAGPARMQALAAHRLAGLRLLGKTVDSGLTNPAGQKFAVSDFRGKWLLVVFLSHRALDGPATVLAVDEMLARRPDARVLLVSLDPLPADLAAWQGLWAQGRARNWPVHFDGLGRGTPLARQFGVRGEQAVMLVDPEGKLATLDALADGPRLLWGERPRAVPATSQPQP